MRCFGETQNPDHGLRETGAGHKLSRAWRPILRRLTIRNVLLLAVFAVGADAGAQSGGGPYRIAPVAVAAGGGTLSGGTFGLAGTFGQAPTSVSSATTYTFYAGIWTRTSDVIFANNFEN